MKILIIGYNARPVTSALKLLGHTTYVIDYWGDTDIKPYADQLITLKKLLKDQKDEEQLIPELTDKVLKKHPQTDYAMICSGYDDETEIWKKIQEKIPLLNIPINTLTKIRDREELAKTLKQNKIPHIPLKKTETLDQAIKYAEKINYPIIIRPEKSSGAYKLKIIQNQTELEKNITEKQKIYIEKYIPTKISLSQIVNTRQNESKILATSLQLLKEYSLGHPPPLGYAGNITPYKNPDIEEKLNNTTKKILKKYDLTGIIGLDYILTPENQIYLTEINPRIPGSIDTAQITTQTNLVEHHLKAFQTNQLPKPPEHKGYATKIIIKTKTTYKTSSIPPYLPIADIYPQNLTLPPNTPICTIHTYSPYSPQQSYMQAKKIAGIIYLLNKNNDGV